MLFSIIFSITVFLFFLTYEIITRYINFRTTLSPINIFIVSIINFIILFIICYYLIFINIQIERYVVSFVYYNLYIVIYLHLFIGISKSVSLRVMDEINLSKTVLNIDDLNKSYSSDDFFNKRITLLIENKWLNYENNHVKCSRKGTILVKINLFFLKLYKIANSG